MAEKPTYEELERRVQELEKIECEYKSTKKSLQKDEESLEKYKNIVSSTTDAIAYLDENYRYIIVNNAYEDFSGANQDDFVGLTVAEYMGKDVFEEKIKSNLDRCLNGEIVNYQEWFKYPTKGKRFVDVTYFPYRDGKNHISGVIANTRDITERKKAEEELRQSEMRIRQVIDLVPHFIFAKDVHGTFLLANKTVADAYGISPENLIGKSDYDFTQNTEEVDFFIECDKKVIESGTGLYNIKESITDAKGSRRYLETTKIPFTTSSTTTPAMLGVSVDITERKQAEAEREKIQAQLTQAQKMESVGRLAGGVAHDFNNMLGVILGHTELALLQADEKHDLYSDLKEIQTAATRSADITKQLLAFARKQTISPIQLDLNNTVESMLNMLRRLIGEDIDLVWRPTSHLWPVKMDPSQIDQILANLCVNARDAISGVGKLSIETGIKTFDEAYCKEHSGFIPGEFVLLAVSDDGCGMDKETLNNLFEPFFTTKDVGKGTGLGLATIYGIVKQNNGFINVYSEPDQGSTFKIYLPRYLVPDEIPAIVHSEKPDPRGNETILLVEDDHAILNMTRIMLERKGYSVLPAATPAEAIDLAKTHADKIHLLMTDVVMPEMNGRDLAKRLTAHFPDIKLLFMSGYTANVIAHQGVLDKKVAFIQKPFSMKDLAEKVREILDKASNEAQVSNTRNFPRPFYR